MEQTGKGKTLDKEKFKKTLAYVFIGVLFVGTMYFILSLMLKKGEQSNNGVNDEVPDADIVSMPDNKMKAYKMRSLDGVSHEAQQEARLNSLYEFYDEQISQEQARTEQVNQEDESLEKAISAFNSVGLVQKDYDRYVADKDPRIIDLQSKIEKLEKEKAEQELILDRYKSEENQFDQNMQLLEQSYQMAAKYTGKFPSTLSSADTVPQIRINKNTLETISTVNKRDNVVSSLQQFEEDSVFLQKKEEAFNEAFTTAVGGIDHNEFANTIPVLIDETIIVKIGDDVRLRIMDDIRLLNGIIIPRNTKLVAGSSLSGNRLKLNVSSVEFEGYIVGVDLSAYDLQGREGLYVPLSDEASAVQELGVGLAETSSSGFNIGRSAADQVTADLSRSLIRAGGNYIRKKAQTIKVTIPAGHKLYLYDKANKQKQ